MTGKKKREFNWQAVEHVGNDADEGGFLGNAEAELEKTGRPAVSLVPPPAREQVPASTSEPLSTDLPPTAASESVVPEPVRESQTDRQAARSGSNEVGTLLDDQRSTAGMSTEAGFPSTPPAGSTQATQGSAAPAEPAPTKAAGRNTRRSSGRPNDGPQFTPSGAQPPILRTRGRRAKEKEAQAAVVASFIDQRTTRNWSIWSGRLVPDVTRRLQNRADADGLSSGRSRLGPGHYFDAAIRRLPDDPAELAALANSWLIEVWDGEHARGENAQFSVSPDVHAKLSGLRRSLRDFRHGMVIDVVSAAADVFLDRLDAEGPLP
jgi:hypothetical protein